MILTVDKYPEETVALYSPDNKFIDNVNAVELMAFRIKIKKNKISGYFIITESEDTIIFDENGSPDHWPENLFSDLVKLSRKFTWGY